MGRKIKFYRIATLYTCACLTVIILLMLKGLGWI